MSTATIEQKQAKTRSYTQTAQAVIQTELQAIQRLLASLDGAFDRACELMLACQGKIIVIGMGKSGHIGRKIAATLASTGTPAFFVHPGEASHGDLGMISTNDLVIAISNSGNTQEVVALLPMLKRLAIPVISLAGNPDSLLAQHADVNLDVSVEKEACTLGLAPTSSTTVTLVMGDALAISLLEARGFNEQDFAYSHPGGSLGKKLLVRIEDIMTTGQQIPHVTAQATVSEALLEMTSKGLGMTAIVDEQMTVLGLFTDGDLRRALKNNVNVQNTPVIEVMTASCKTTSKDKLAHEVLCMMESKKINGLLVTDQNNQLIGCLNIHNLLQAKVF